jgi:hypothetical protein
MDMLTDCAQTKRLNAEAVLATQCIRWNCDIMDPPPRFEIIAPEIIENVTGSFLLCYR